MFFLTKNIQIMHLLLLKFIKSVGLLVPVKILRHATRPEIKVLSYYKDPRLCCLYFSAVITDHSLKIKDNRKDHKWVFRNNAIEEPFFIHQRN